MINAGVEMDREILQFRLSPLELEHAIVRLKYPSRQQSRQMQPVRNSFQLIRNRFHQLASQISRHGQSVSNEQHCMTYVASSCQICPRDDDKRTDADISQSVYASGLARRFQIGPSLADFPAAVD